jgi:hypothetical protein
MKINTGIKMTSKFSSILNSVIGQMSDGIWENTRSMEKYWKSLDYSTDPAGYIIIEDSHYVCANPVDFFANKIKQIIKIEMDDGNRDLAWSRTCSATPFYMHGGVTVGDCYELYELLKGRDTTKYSYASYEPYRVNLEYAGVSFDITVEALNQSDAKAKAIKKFAEQATCTIYK